MGYRALEENGLLMPIFKIYIAGKEIPSKYYEVIQEVRYEDHDSGSDTAEIQMADPLMEIMEDASIIRGSKIKIIGGWRDRSGKEDVDNWLDGYITMVDADFPDDGLPMLSIQCMDESFALDKDDEEANYTSMTFKGLVSTIINKSKYKGMFRISSKSGGGSKVHEEISQTGESDLKLLLRMADEEDLGFKIKNGEIIWWNTLDKYEKQDKFYEMHWKEEPFDLKSFQCRVVISDAKTKKEGDVTNNKTEETAKGKTNPKKDGTSDTSSYTYDGGSDKTWIKN
jgi:hypothetical protein